MKKILCALFAMVVANVVSAATVGWTLAGANSYAGDAYQVFIIGYNEVASMNAITALLDAGNDVSSYAAGSGTIAANGTANKTSGTGVELPGGATYSAFFVVYDSATLTAGETKYITISSAQNSGMTQSPTATAAKISFVGQNQANYLNNTANWASFGPAATPVDPDPIPEPTTAALLALGLAAFGLKRKVA
ncbi:MAG: PEP-CTERM sorting domain-containing protein [Kiritimatiellae bacterium]|nr:PEP-CTERM sorting domain-containing protein [Kiritimatiellia bacterium]